MTNYNSLFGSLLRGDWLKVSTERQPSDDREMTERRNKVHDRLRSLRAPHVQRMLRFAAAFLLLLTIGVGNVWGETVTFTPSNCLSWTSSTATQTEVLSGITLECSSAINNTQLRLYIGSTTTISSTVGNITKVEITCTASGTSNYGPGKLSVKSGSAGSYTYSDKIGTWTGNAATLSLTASAQSRATQIVVTYTPSCESLTMSSVTATPGDGQIALSWPAVSHADSYTVSCKVKSSGVAAGTGTGSKTGTSCTIMGLTNGTEYTWSVEPVGSGDYCDTNTPATGDITPNVTRTITYYDKDGQHTTSLTDGTNIATALSALYGEDDPVSCNTDDYEYFVGWTNAEISGSASSVTLLSTEVVSASTAADSYYAVWSDTEPIDYSTTYTSNVELPKSDDTNTKATVSKASINSTNYDAIKLGSSKAGGSFTVTIDKGTTKLHLHALAWNGESNKTLELKLSAGSITPSSAQTLTPNSGVSGSGTTYTLSNISNDFYEYTLSNVSSNAYLTLTCSGRCLVWGVNAVSSSGGSAKYITTCCTPLGGINGSIEWGRKRRGNRAFV